MGVFLRLEAFPRTLIMGQSMRMSFASNSTFELWKNFMPHRHKIANERHPDLFSLQQYGIGFDWRDPDCEFVKWAGIEVKANHEPVDGMQTFEIPDGRYAVFKHTGPPESAVATFGYIFNSWLPASGFALDDRPHFEILGEKYNHGALDSEEEIWIPIQ